MIQDSTARLSMVTLGRIQFDFGKEKRRRVIHPRELRDRISHPHFQSPWSSDYSMDIPNSFPLSSLLLFLPRMFFPWSLHRVHASASLQVASPSLFPQGGFLSSPFLGLLLPPHSLSNALSHFIFLQKLYRHT